MKEKDLKRVIDYSARVSGSVLALLLGSVLVGCAAGGGSKSDDAFIGGAVNLQLDVSFAGGGKPPGKAPGNLIAAMKSPGKEGRWQPAIFLYSQQSVTIEARISGQQKKVTVHFPEACCNVTATAGDGVKITAPVWTPDQKNNKRAYYFDLKVDGMLIDPVIIPR
jgi:hypothetical protein